MKSELKSDAK